MALSRISWSSKSLERVVRQLNTNLEQGLSSDEADVRRERVGANLLQRGHELGIFGKIIKQFKSPLVFILLFAGVATIVLQAFLDTIVIFIALSINIIIGTFHEERASRAFEKLSKSQERYATVIRSGRKIVISASELVPGDIVEIASGSYVPADIRLIEVKSLSLNEAALTGEWVAVSKDVAVPGENAPIAEQFNMAWMGTLVSAGAGKGVVVETGARTQVGIIALEVSRVEERATPLQQNVQNIARFLVYIIGIAITLIFVLGLVRGESIGNMLLVSVAIAVAALPSGLPAAVTVVLALGMESILKRGGLVRNLLAAETLGSTTVILTDKTGTLTQAKMTLSEKLTAYGIRSGKETSDEKELLRAAVITSDAFVEQGIDPQKKTLMHGRPMEKAIILSGLDEGLSQQSLFHEEERLDFLRFESSRRFAVSLNTHNSRKRLYITGSPELLLEHAGSYYERGEKKKLTEVTRTLFAREQELRSREGMRILAVAYKDVSWTELPGSAQAEEDGKILENIVFLGLLVFSDPVRPDVAVAISTVRRAGARVLMLTGDNPQTAARIAHDVGIANKGEKVLLGVEIEKMNDDELLEALAETRVFARVLPTQKLRISRVLKNAKEVVAMTGDGINDAPALRSADIGIAIGSGTEVAKEASDLILLDDSFSIIAAAIEEGRKIIDNLKKIVAYLLSTGFSEIIVISGALIVGAPLPLLPTQILWANIVGEGLMSFSFAFEKKEKGIMLRDPRSQASKRVLTRPVKTLIFTISAITGIFLLVLYAVLLRLDMPIEEIRTIMFATLSVDSIFFAFSFKSLQRSVWKINIFSNVYLLFALAGSFLLLIGALSLAPLQKLLTLTPLTLFQILFLVGVGIFNLFAIEIAKYFIFERKGRSMD